MNEITSKYADDPDFWKRKSRSPDEKLKLIADSIKNRLPIVLVTYDIGKDGYVLIGEFGKFLVPDEITDEIEKIIGGYERY